MKVGDKVRVFGEETEIIAMGYDEEGDKIYTVKGSTEDYYEHQIEQMTFHLLRSILYLATGELEKGNRETSAILLYDELVELKELMDSRERLEARWKLTQEENELARKSLIENSNIADERNDLLVEAQRLKENSISKDKIKEKIEETRSKMHKFESDNANRLYLEHFNNNYYNRQSKKYGVFNTQEVITHYRLQEYVIKMGALQELLKGE